MASWTNSAYDNRTLVTQVGDAHADTAGDDVVPASDRPPTSSSTLPSLVLRMFDVAEIEEGMRVLDLGTGSGYSAALLGRRLGDDHVLSVDVDEYLVNAARQRLGPVHRWFIRQARSTCGGNSNARGTSSRSMDRSIRPPSVWRSPQTVSR
ncbi:methyltransferase domain-containing protein [Embleya sp. AB8]|uniref:methyltransferase domain-containing protein n=1 Tax=Embleya sp. AB8 TaxID=3156304 RepID=UPI003C710611